MELFTAAVQALASGMAPLVVVVLILLAVVSKDLRDLIKETRETNVRLDGLHSAIDNHGAHQSARMEEIRKFMVNWWERFGTFESAQARHRRRTTDASQDDIPRSDQW